VHRYEGTVNQVMGDGIMALFGVPIAHEDHAVRACYAALAMQASVQQYAAAVSRPKGVPNHIRVGLNSGEVVVRAIGSDLHMDYTAVGQTTHLAARMEQMAMPGSILITPEVLRLAEGYVQVKALGPVSVKGLHAPLEVYEVLATGVVRSRLQAAAVRGLAPFVGRDRELSQLHQALEWAGSGHGQLVALVGEPGVGKSRLAEECLHAPRTQGWLVLESRAMSYGQATPYLPVIDLLKDYCGIDASDDPPRRREKVLGSVVGLDEALEPILPPILALLDVPVDEAHWQRLDPLPPASADELLQALLGDDTQLHPLKRLLIERTEGNPFFLEESVRTLVEIHVLVGERGAYRVEQALPTIQVPATVQAVLAARIDRLPPEEKRLLQTAAVIGTEVPCPCCKSSPSFLRTPSTAASRTSRPPSSCMRHACFPTTNTPSSTPSPSRWPTRRCSRGGGGRCMPTSSKPWSCSPGSGWPSRWTAWRTTLCGGRCGARPWRTAGGRERRP
jgi:hypothetical protein